LSVFSRMIVYTLLGLLPSASSISASWMRRSSSMPSRARRARYCPLQTGTKEKK
jgi:hypothetical protein